MKTFITYLFSISFAWSQILIEGSVLSSVTKEPISNANVLVLGTSDGAASNTDGYFQIETEFDIPIELVVSHIAFVSKLIAVTNLSNIIVYLEPTIIPGDEISVTGKYSRAEQDVSSSTKSISFEEMESLGASDVSDALRTISSANIEQGGGGKQTISIRGSNANEVSVYLDGIRLNDAYTNTANIAAIDQNDLFSIEIIKGGSSTLFSNGNFGGIVFLNTQLPDSTEIKFARGIGLQNNKNQDLSFGAAGRFGPIAIGGRYSGKARRYHGRSTYTTIFNNLAFSTFPDNGILDIKAYYLEDYLTLPTESVVQSAQTQLGMIRYRGSLSKSKNWELFASAKLWNWDDDFFSNLSRNIDDKTITTRVGKGFNTSKFKSMINYEYEAQDYIANNERTPDYPDLAIFAGKNLVEYGELSRVNQSVSGVLQLKSSVNNSVTQQLLWELGFRADNINTAHSQSLDYINTLTHTYPPIYTLETTNFDTTFSNLLTGFKIGVNASGKTSQIQYKLFLNQGRSSRLPTLNDLYLSNNRSVGFNLGQEKLSSTEIGLEVGNDVISNNVEVGVFVVSGGFFINNYSNKIAYQFLDGIPPIPYNIDLSKISGFDINFFASLYRDIVRINAGYQKLNIDNPVVFPNKPSSKFTVNAEFGNKIFSLGYDFFREGSQFIVYNGFVGNALESRKNTNISLIIKKRIWRADLSLQYVIHNVYSENPVIADPEINYLSPFNFFDVHRQILTLKIQL